MLNKPEKNDIGWCLLERRGLVSGGERTQPILVQDALTGKLTRYMAFHKLPTEYQNMIYKDIIDLYGVELFDWVDFFRRGIQRRLSFYDFLDGDTITQMVDYLKKVQHVSGKYSIMYDELVTRYGPVISDCRRKREIQREIEKRRANWGIKKN